ncbi:MAG: response regulator [Actinomycetota bacterium]|jgi:DNA-binding response OmpR family regulator|nr:response regulator [Actinomycetota bacterium]
MTIRVLVVDDDQDLLDMLAISLRSRGFEVGLADCHSAALELVANNTYDTVLLDVHLPELNGFSVLADLRAAGHDLPVVLHTAFDTQDIKRQAREARVDDIVFKPSRSEIIAAKLRMVVAERTNLVVAV